MSAPVLATVVKMMESLPDPVQDRVAEHLREYIADLREELQWDTTFQKPNPNSSPPHDASNKKALRGRQNP